MKLNELKPGDKFKLVRTGVTYVFIRNDSHHKILVRELTEHNSPMTKLDAQCKVEKI